MNGFFAVGQFRKTGRPLPSITLCGQCGLLHHCHSPKMPVDGAGRRGVMIIAECPGKSEDQQNRPLVGRSGQKLWATLRKLGWERDDFWITNAVICRPHTDEGNNRNPTSTEVESCRGAVFSVIAKYRPHCIILLGAKSVESIMGVVWKKSVGDMGRWAGWTIPCQRLNAWLCPTWHPSYLGRQEEPNPVLELWWERHLTAALAKTARPWPEGVPDYQSRVESIFNPDEAAEAIRQFIAARKPTAFDYETTCLKPESGVARILCCSLSDGTRTIAYPWTGAAIAASKEFLLSPVPKIAANMKFEARWTARQVLEGQDINNLAWDTMVAAHCLDSRGNIAGLKFQAFARFGQTSYDDHLEMYRRSQGKGRGNSVNRMAEVDNRDLLRYCGVDSLLEYKLAIEQRQEVGAATGPDGVEASSKSAYQLFHQGTLALTRVEGNGLCIDHQSLDRSLAEVSSLIQAAEDRLTCGPEWRAWQKRYQQPNLGSRSQLAAVLFDELGIEYKEEWGTTRGGRYRTDDAVLSLIDSDFVRAYRDLDDWRKLKGTYLEGLKNEAVNGKVHAFFHLAGGGDTAEDKGGGARSWRGSASDVNLQNIPTRNPKMAEHIRRAIVPQPGNVFTEVDCAAHEFRMCGIIWNDPNMMKYARDKKLDVHRDWAAKCFRLANEQVSKDSRYCGKNGFIFPRVYGSWSKSIAPNLWAMIDDKKLVTVPHAGLPAVPMKEWLASQGITALGACDRQQRPVPGTFEHHVAQVQDEFDRSFPTWSQDKEVKWKEYQSRGWFRLASGFVCKGIVSRNQFYSYRVQGPSFHCLLWALIQAEQELRRLGMRSLIVNTIHDCILFDGPPAEVEYIVTMMERLLGTDIRKAWPWVTLPLESENEICVQDWFHKISYHKWLELGRPVRLDDLSRTDLDKLGWTNVELEYE